MQVHNENEYINKSMAYLTPFTTTLLTEQQRMASIPLPSTSSISDTISKALNENDYPGKPFCYLLEIDQFKLLFDCGARIIQNGLEITHLLPLKDILKELNGIFITHADIEHMGGLPFLVHLSGGYLPCPIYLTSASQSMSQVLLLDILQDWSMTMQPSNVSSKDNNLDIMDIAGYTRSAIQTTLERMIGVKYSQPIQLGEFVFTAFSAGHSLGGSYWRVRKGRLDITAIYHDDFIYASHIFPRKDRHLNPTHLVTHVLDHRPGVFITDATNALGTRLERKQKDTELIDMIIGHFRHETGNILIPIPPVGRVLDILLLLESTWQLHRFQYPIYLIGSQASKMIEISKSMLEWMNESILKSFSANRENPFEFKYIKILSSYEELAQISQTKYIALASGPFLSYGTSRRIFYDWISNSSHLIIFPSLSPPIGTLSHVLLQYRNAEQQPILSFQVTILEKLQGKELEQYQQSLKEHVAPIVETEELVDYEEEEDEEQVIVPVHSSWSQKYFDAYLTKEGIPSRSSKSNTDTIRPIHFPYDEKYTTAGWTSYGDVISQQEWPEFMAHVAENEALAKKAEQKSASDTQFGRIHISGALGQMLQPLGSLDQAYPDKITAPTKKIFIPSFNGPVSCELFWMDLDGICDAKSMKAIVEQIQPRKIVLIQGTKASLLFMKQTISCISLEIITCKNECMNISSSATTSIGVKLGSTFLESIDISKRGEYEIYRLHNDQLVDFMIEHEHTNFDILNSIYSSINVENDKGYKKLFINDVKLAQAKHILEQIGLSAVWKPGGRLLVSDIIYITKVRCNCYLEYIVFIF